MRTPTADALAALADKYRTLVEIHEALAAWDDARAKALDRDVATRFPGALRELQTLPLDELVRRRDALGRAAAGGAVEPWMGWMADYHALVRVALELRRARGADAAMQHIVSDAATRGLPVDAAFAARAAAGARLAAVACEAIARAAGVATATVEAALLARRSRRSL